MREVRVVVSVIQGKHDDCKNRNRNLNQKNDKGKPENNLISSSACGSMHEDNLPAAESEGKLYLRLVGAESPTLVACRIGELVSTKSSSTWNPTAS